MSKKNPAIIAKNNMSFQPEIGPSLAEKKTSKKNKIKIKFSADPIILKRANKLVCNIPKKTNNKNKINNFGRISIFLFYNRL